MTTEEIWKKIEGFDYSISSFGRVRSDRKNRVLTAKEHQDGYKYQRLWKNGDSTKRLLHQLVAEYFLPPKPSPAHVPNHKDLNKGNNRADNIEWMTRGENTRHAHAAGVVPYLRGEGNGASKLTNDAVQEIRRMKGKEGQRRIAKRFGVTKNTIAQIHQGKKWKSLPWPTETR